ncbi:hypothetical protein OQA88_4795 [Cercophora sp. LCS_1]
MEGRKSRSKVMTADELQAEKTRARKLEQECKEKEDLLEKQLQEAKNDANEYFLRWKLASSDLTRVRPGGDLDMLDDKYLISRVKGLRLVVRNLAVLFFTTPETD